MSHAQQRPERSRNLRGWRLPRELHRFLVTAHVVDMARYPKGLSVSAAPRAHHLDCTDRWHGALSHQPTRRRASWRCNDRRVAEVSLDIPGALCRVQPRRTRPHPDRQVSRLTSRVGTTAVEHGLDVLELVAEMKAQPKRTSLPE